MSQPFPSDIGNPDTPSVLIHFTGRPRARRPLPIGVPIAAEERLARILIEGRILATRTFGTVGPVVCFSELSYPALVHQLERGFTPRGSYEPWALVLWKTWVLYFGTRPVFYVSGDEWNAMSGLPANLLDRRVRSVPGAELDWMHEREWRLCLNQWNSDSVAPCHALMPQSVAAVIVGRPGWTAGELLPHSVTGCTRWLWTGRGLVNDGVM